MNVLETIRRNNFTIHPAIIPLFFLMLYAVGKGLGLVGVINLGEVLTLLGWTPFLVTAIPIWAWYFVKLTRPKDERIQHDRL